MSFSQEKRVRGKVTNNTLEASLTISDYIVDMSFCISLRNFIQIGPPQHKKIDVMSIFTMADLRHLEFQGSNNVLFEKRLPIGRR